MSLERNEWLCTYFKSLGACGPAIRWVGRHADATPAELWRMCRHGEWLVWLLAEMGYDHWALADLAAHELAPLVLEAIGAHCWATELRALPPIADEQSAAEVECWLRFAYADAWAAATAADTAAATAATADAWAAAAYPAICAVADRAARQASPCRVATIVRSHIPWSAVEPLLAVKLKEVA